MLKKVSVEDNIDWDYLVAKTEYFSGDDINNVCRDASMMPLRRELSNKLELDNPEAMKEVQERLRVIPVSMPDFICALEFLWVAIGGRIGQQHHLTCSKFAAAHLLLLHHQPGD